MAGFKLTPEQEIKRKSAVIYSNKTRVRSEQERLNRSNAAKNSEKLKEHHKKLSEILKGHKGAWNGRHHTEETKKKMSARRIEIWKDTAYQNKQSEQVRKGLYKTWEPIDKEVLELEKQGFTCIPITSVIPDIIAVKNGKIYAIEVEYGIPNYIKYDKNNYKNRFDKVIWLLRK